MENIALTPSDVAFRHLSYAFGRIGRCIASGGRRMDRFSFERNYTYTIPTVSGRTEGPKGFFKDYITAIRTRTYGHEWKEISAKPVKQLQPRSTRKERREAAREASRATRRIQREPQDTESWVVSKLSDGQPG